MPHAPVLNRHKLDLALSRRSGDSAAVRLKARVLWSSLQKAFRYPQALRPDGSRIDLSSACLPKSTRQPWIGWQRYRRTLLKIHLPLLITEHECRRATMVVFEEPTRVAALPLRLFHLSTASSHHALIQIAVLVVLRPFPRDLRGKARVGELIHPDTRRNGDSTGHLGSLFAGLGRGRRLPAELPA